MVFEKVMAKITKRFNYGNFYIHRGLNMLGGIFLPKKNGFAKESNFNPKTAISAMTLKLCVTTCLYLT